MITALLEYGAGAFAGLFLLYVGYVAGRADLFDDAIEAVRNLIADARMYTERQR